MLTAVTPLRIESSKHVTLFPRWARDGKNHALQNLTIVLRERKIPCNRNNAQRYGRTKLRQSHLLGAGANPPDKWLTFGFAFVGGYGDAAGFVLAKTFTGHVTGSLVLGAIATAAHDWRGVLAHSSAVACFLAGIPIAMLMARLLAAWPSWPPLAVATVMEVILIVAAYWALASRAASAVELFVVCVSLALGLQNAAFRRTGGISVHTTYLTGMITGLLATEAEKIIMPVTPHRVTGLDPKFWFHCGIWSVFLLGAATGAAAVPHFKEVRILGAALILVAIIVRNLLASPSKSS